MADAFEFETELSRLSGDTYRVWVRLFIPSSNDLPATNSGDITFRIDELNELRAKQDLDGYARALSQDFFKSADGLVAREYGRALDLASKGEDIRFRLLIDEGAPQLQALMWETLLDPLDAEGGRLCTNPRVFFCRAIQRGRPRHFTLREKHKVRALIVVANPKLPKGIAAGHPIDVSGEVARATAGLNGIATTVLASSEAEPGAANLDCILRELESSYDILYLVCHGSFDSQLADSRLNLEKPDGTLDRVSGKEFVTRIGRLAAAPNFIILCACQSGGPEIVPIGTEGRETSQSVLTALGPRLVRSGIPAVLAMQGNLLMETAAQFFPVMLQELMEKGTIDRAVTIARNKAGRQRDFFVPVLFQRIRSGRLWYGTNEDPSVSNINWQGLLSDVRNGNGVVVMGSSLLDPYIGAQSELALQLAQRYNYPFGDTERDDLAMVGEYLASIGRDAFQKEVLREWALQIIRDYGSLIPDLLQGKTKDQIAASSRPQDAVEEMLSAAWRFRCSRDDFETHKALASIPFRAYISTNPDTLVEQALKEGGAEPLVWRMGRNPQRRGGTKFDPRKHAIPEVPLIAYLYGTLDDPNSLVLTEEDYYKQLVSAAQGEGMVPALNGVFTSSALMFLGFRLHEWDFRVLFRRLKIIPGWGQHMNYNHVAVQIDPSTARGSASQQTVRRFLSHFFETSKIEVFQGSAQQFVRELRSRCQAERIPLREAAGVSATR